MKYYLITLLFLFLNFPAVCYGSTSPSLFINENFTSSPLEPYLSIYADKTGHENIDTLCSGQLASRFTPSNGKPLNMGVTDSPCWVKFTIHNSQPKPEKLVLELGTSTINTAILYTPRGDGGYSSKSTGDKHPIDERDFFHRRPVFSFTVPGDSENTYFLYLKTNAILETSLKVLTEDAFAARIPVEYLLLGMFYSAFIFAIIYNLFLYASLRDTSRLLYVLYAFSFCMIWVFLDGLWHQFGLATPFLDQLQGARITNASTCMMMVLFTAWFFDCRNSSPRLFKILMFIAFWSAVNTIMVCMLPLADYKAPVRLAWLASIPTVLFTAFLYWKRGLKRARYFLAAWLLVLVGASVFFMDMYLNLIPSHFLSRNAWRIASVIEIVLLSLALADRINELNEERDQAQQWALQAEKQLKEGLEAVVAQRTQELEQRSQELEKVNLKLERLSQMDELTGLYNRRYFDNALSTEWQRMKRSGDFLCLVMLDVDHFKLYNDTYGHQSGDTCLQSIAKSLKSRANRSSDICARYGGEEFALILPSTDIDGGTSIAESIRAHVMDKHIPHTTKTGIVTVSLGVAAVIPDLMSSPADLLKLADKALYRSKEKGRNTVSNITEDNLG